MMISLTQMWFLHAEKGVDAVGDTSGLRKGDIAGQIGEQGTGRAGQVERRILSLRGRRRK